MSTIPITLLPPVTLGGNQTQQSSLPSSFGAMLGQAIQGLQQGQDTANQTIQQAMVVSWLVICPAVRALRLV